MKKISIFELLSEINPKLLEAEEVAARVTAKKRLKRRTKRGGIVLLVLLLLFPAKYFLSNQISAPLDDFLSSILSDSTTAPEATPPSEASSSPAVIVPEISEPATSFTPGASSEPDASSKPDVTEPDATGSAMTEPTSPFVLPVQGTLIKKYDSYLQEFQPNMGIYVAHNGIDVRTEADAPILAAADGRITKIWTDPNYGVCLAIEHADSIVTIYKNLSITLPPGIAEGVSVTQGMTVATVGATSLEEPMGTPFLHFEMTRDDLLVDPLDYLDETPWLNTEAEP